MLNNYADYEIIKLHSCLDLYNRIESFGDYIAFNDNGVEISYSKFTSDIKKVSASFNKKGKFVIINCENKYNYVLSYFSVILSGNIACVQPYSTEIYAPFKGFEIYAIVNDDFVTTALTENEGKNGIDYTPDKYAMCTVLCSSGTTATPKAVALSQYNMMTDLVAGMEKFEYAFNGRFVNILPYSHAFGLCCDLFGPLYSCSTICFAYSTIDFFGKLTTFNPTALNIIPALVKAMAMQIKAFGNKEKVVGTSLKKILSGGAGTPKELCETMSLYGIQTYGCYGLSECGPCVAVNRDNYYKYGSAGGLLNCNTAKIKETGEIAITGCNIMLGYLNSDGTLNKVTDATFHTGDIGYIDNDGFIYISGRIDDTIVFLDGTKLMPTAIEEEINKISGVNESIVYYKNEKLCAYVCVYNEQVSEVVKAEILKTTYLGYRVNSVTVGIDPVIKNAMGKINRKAYLKD